MCRLRSLLSYNILNFGSPASLRLLWLYQLLGPWLPLQEAPREPCLMTCSIIRVRHPMSPAAIHPVPPPNGQGKGGINYYYYTRPQICFFPTWNPRQLHPAVSKHPQHPFWWCSCLHMFTYPRLTQIHPLHALPSHLAPTASKIPLPALINIPHPTNRCHILLYVALGQLATRSLPL